MRSECGREGQIGRVGKGMDVIKSENNLNNDMVVVSPIITLEVK